jgi:RNA polymerase sigma-70 factor (ECF subfamily)
MLGSIAEEEDVVQDAFIRWHQTDRAEVREPEAFLVRMEARPCLDVLISARGCRSRCSTLPKIIATILR